jgi:RNA polymerase-binding transcription factor DksA
LSFSDEKRRHFLAIFDGDESKVAELEKRLSDLKGQAENEGRDSKETDSATEEDSKETESEEKEAPVTEETTSDEVQNDFASREEIAETLAGVIEPVAKTLQDLSSRLSAIESSVKELEVGRNQSS